MSGQSAVLVIALILCSCTRTETPEEVLLHARALYADGKVEAAIAAIDRGLQTTGKQSNYWYWKFSLQKSSYLRAKGVQESLEPLQPEPPNDPALGELRARRKLYQGWGEFSLAHYGVAAQRLDEAAALATAANSRAVLAYTELYQAYTLNLRGHGDEAEVKLRAGLDDAAASGDGDIQDYGLETAANILEIQSRWEEALHAYEARLPKVEAKGDRNALARLLINMGSCTARLGEYDQALALLERAEGLSRQSGNREILTKALVSAGNVYEAQREFPSARKYFAEALELATGFGDKSLIAPCLNNLASIAIATKDWDLAERYNAQALREARGNGKSTLYAQVHIAQTLAGQGKYPEAERLFAEVAGAKGSDGPPPLKAHAGLARMYATLGRDSKAVDEFEAALKVVEKSRAGLKDSENKLTFLSSLIEVHQSYVDFLMARGKTERALEIAEASRARILLEQFGRGAAPQELNAAAYRRLAGASGSILVSYWLGPERSFVWVITRDNILAYTLPAEARMRQLVEQYRAFIEKLNDPLTSEDPVARELFDAVLGPVMENVPAGGNLIVVPNGALHALNFETLPLPGERPGYFIERATISMAPSLNLLASSKPRARTGGRLLLIGDPALPDGEFAELPFAKDEMRLIRARFDPAKTRAYQQREATPVVYRQAAADGFDYVHFAAHLSANRQRPLDSAIILAGPAGANKLTAGEVVSRPLDAGLVTISACRGAGSKTYGGEGLVGFTWAFFEAGAHNVVSGLWDVSDESTPALMDAFYAGLTEGQPPAKALREAKLRLMASNPLYKRPYYWAPFLLYTRDVAAPPSAGAGLLARTATTRILR